MPKISGKKQKIFGGNSSNNAQFGSARAGTFILNNDPDVIQSLPAWETGINAATISGEKLPALEEVQGVDYVVTRQLAYILQEGIPEYLSNSIYYENSIVKEPGTYKIYGSLTDDNTGNPLSDGVNWQLLCDLSAIPVLPINNYTATTDPTVNDDASDGYSTGSVWYNSTGTGEAFLCVNATIGAAKWIKTTLTVDELGSAAFQPSSAFATAAQGALADTAVQPGQSVTVLNGGAIVTPWVAYTSTLTAFGTPSFNEFYSRRVGDTLEIMGKFIAGTPTGTEARFSLGFNGTSGGISISNTKVPSTISTVGSWTFGNNNGAYSGYCLAERGLGFITFGWQQSANSGLVKISGSGLSVSGTVFSLYAKVPIQGW